MSIHLNDPGNLKTKNYEDPKFKVPVTTACNDILKYFMSHKLLPVLVARPFPRNFIIICAFCSYCVGTILSVINVSNAMSLVTPALL